MALTIAWWFGCLCLMASLLLASVEGVSMLERRVLGAGWNSMGSCWGVEGGGGACCLLLMLLLLGLMLTPNWVRASSNSNGVEDCTRS